jgi:hypothetical protein
MNEIQNAKYKGRHCAGMTLPIFRFLVGCVVLSLAGCADGLPERVPVSGTVFIDGKPLTKGSIMVIPDGERAAGGSIGPDGRFQLTSYELNDGVVTGTHRVTVQATEHIGERDTRWLTPKKYGDAATSGLSITVTEPTDDLKIELSWDGKGPYVEKM